MQDILNNPFLANALSAVFITVVLAVYYFAYQKSAGEHERNLELQAQKRNGTVQKGGPFSYPRLSLLRETGEVLVFPVPGGKNSPPYTHVTAEINSTREYRIKVCREHRIFGVGAVFGQDIRVNHPDFDEAFLVQGSDEMIVLEYLTPDAQARILGLKDLDPELEINKNKFRFSIKRIAADEAMYDQLIDAGLALFDRARELG